MREFTTGPKGPGVVLSSPDNIEPDWRLNAPGKWAKTLVRTLVTTRAIPSARSRGRPKLSQDEEPDLSGLQIDRYRLVRQLGVGGMGAVYEAEHTTLRKRFAVKILRGADAANELSRQRFLREAEAASLIDHPHVVAVTDCGQIPDGRVFLVMELLRGRDLGQLLDEEGKLPWSRAKSILVQIATALDAAHRKEVLHRDVKPSNCFLVEDVNVEGDFVKVLDFGVAKLMGGLGEAAASLTSTGDLLGSVAYVAPERVLEEDIDYRSDIYALGVMMFRMLSGSLPYREGDALAILRQHMQAPIPRVSDLEPSISPGVEAIVRRAMAKDPDDRFQSMRAFAEALRADGIGLEETREVVVPSHTPSIESTVVLEAFVRTTNENARAIHETTTTQLEDSTIRTALPDTVSIERPDEAPSPARMQTVLMAEPGPIPTVPAHGLYATTRPSPGAVPNGGPSVGTGHSPTLRRKKRRLAATLAAAGVLSVVAAIGTWYWLPVPDADETSNLRPAPAESVAVSVPGTSAPPPASAQAATPEPERSTTAGPREVPIDDRTEASTTGDIEMLMGSGTGDDLSKNPASVPQTPISNPKGKPRAVRRRSDDEVVQSMKHRILSKCKATGVQRVRVEGWIDPSGKVLNPIVTPAAGPGVCVKGVVANTRFSAGKTRFIPVFSLML